MRAIRRVAVLVVLALAAGIVVFGLTRAGGSSPPSRDAEPPASFTDREALPACAARIRPQAPPPNDPTWRCLTDAMAAGSAAELKVTATSTEGDPIVTYYRVGPHIHGVETFTDSTADRFAGDTLWWHQRCTNAPPDLGECVELP